MKRIINKRTINYSVECPHTHDELAWHMTYFETYSSARAFMEQMHKVHVRCILTICITTWYSDGVIDIHKRNMEWKPMTQRSLVTA